MDDALEIPPYEPVPPGAALYDAETGMEVDAQPQRACPAPPAPCPDSPAAADAAAVPPDSSGGMSFGDYSDANLAGCGTPRDIALKCGAAHGLAEHRRREEEIRARAVLPGLPPEARAAIAARIPPKRHCSHRRVAVGQIPDPLPEKDNPAALFKNGWLRKGGGAFIVAPSGVGKSSLTIQASMCWALGMEFFGIFPVRRLRIGII